MTKIKNMLKRGFTLTELAIVIAVIAILVAVLVPTFISLIDSANESKDTQMIYNVNQALSIESATTDIKTPSQALDVAAEAGYNIDKLTPTSDSEIYYDQSNVRFVIKFSDGTYYPSSAAEDFEEDAPTTWKFVDEDTYTALNTTANTGSVSYSLAKTTVKSAEETTASGATIHTCSYIAKGDWFTSTLSYTGMGGIDTTRANGISTVEYTIQSATETTYTINPVYSVGEEVSAVTFTIKESIDSITKYCANEKTVEVVVNSTDDNTLSVTVDSVDGNTRNMSWDDDIAITVTFGEKDITAEAYSGVGTSDAISAISSYKEALASGEDTTTVVLELGTEKYPYLIDDLSVVETKVSASSLDTVYFQLTADISITADIEVSVDKNIVLKGSEAGNNIELNIYILKLLTNNDVTIENVNITTSKSYTSIAYGRRPFVIGGISINVIGCTFSGTAPGDYVFEAYANEQSANIVIDNCTFTNAIVALNKIGSGTISVNDTTFKAEGTASSSAYGIATNSCDELIINLTRCKFTGLIRYGFYNQSHITLNLDTVKFDVEFEYTSAETILAAVTSTSVTAECKLCSNSLDSYTINSNVNSSFTYTYSGTTTDISADYAVENN